MRFLVDNALSFEVPRLLSEQGHDAVHVRDYGLAAATDNIIFERASIEDRIIISADTDFGTIFVSQEANKPSVILLRWPLLRNANEQVAVIASNLPNLAEDLEAGSIVIIESDKVRVRRLPITKT